MVKIISVNQQQTWERFLFNRPEASFLHSWQWGLLQKKLGRKIFRVGFFDRQQLQGVALLIKQEAKRGNFLECPGGPLIPWSRQIYFNEFVSYCRRLALQEGCAFVRVRPQLPETIINRLLFKKKGFLPSPMHLHAETTLQLDLSKSEEQILQEMRKNTRYLIKKAQKLGVKIIKSTDPQQTDKLYELQLETVRRVHFVPFPKHFFYQEMVNFLPDNKIRLFKAVYQQKILAMALIIFYGKEAVYHYSGSASKYRKIPASYLLQWEAIKEAKARGLKYYNFWGVSPLNRPDHRFAGVSLFKRGFGGGEVNYLHAHDLPIKSIYWLTYFFETMRKYCRRL